MKSIVETEAKGYSRILFGGRHLNNLDNLKSVLEDKLYSFTREKDKLLFLSVLRKEVEREKIEHEKTCQTKDCRESHEKEMGLFVIDQEIEEISRYYQYEPKPDDEFTTEQKVDLHSKLNEIIEKLEKLGYGQEIIFEEIETLKENFNLGKKNWFQLLKGKLFDLVLTKVLTETIVKDIYQELSDGFDTVKYLLGD